MIQSLDLTLFSQWLEEHEKTKLVWMYFGTILQQRNLKSHVYTSNFEPDLNETEKNFT